MYEIYRIRVLQVMNSVIWGWGINNLYFRYWSCPFFRLIISAVLQLTVSTTTLRNWCHCQAPPRSRFLSIWDNHRINLKNNLFSFAYVRQYATLFSISSLSFSQHVSALCFHLQVSIPWRNLLHCYAVFAFTSGFWATWLCLVRTIFRDKNKSMVQMIDILLLHY
jgi:hypothetical protein